MKKLLSLLVMFSLLLSGAALAEEGEVIELRFQRIGNDAAETEFWKSVIADYEAANPGVKILYDDAAIGDAMDAKLNTLFAANYGPDIIGHGILSVAQRAELGHYIPIDEYFAAWEDGDDMMESVLANGTYKGQLYGLGYSATPYVFASTCWKRRASKCPPPGKS
jgi:ABC-type glycerol-3-phosphate transport system substrate-binding protein